MGNNGPDLAGRTFTRLNPKGHIFQEFNVVRLIHLISDLTSHFGLVTHFPFNNKTKTTHSHLYRCLFSSVLKTYLILPNMQFDGNLSG